MNDELQSLGEDYLHAMRRELDDAEAFVVIDGRGSPPTVETVFYRPWTGGGFRRRQLRLDLEEMAFELGELAVPKVLLKAEDRELEPGLLKLTFELEQLMTIIADGDGRLYRSGELLEADSRSVVDRSSTTRVHIGASREEVFKDLDLPFSARLALDEASDNRVFELRGESRHTRMPEPVWYRILADAGTGEVGLTVDVEATLKGEDRWDVQIDRGQLRRVDEPERQGRERPLPDRLAVILDRTCPDLERWSDARALALGESPKAAVDSYDAEPAASAAGEPLTYRDYNREIRGALSAGLSEALADHQVEVDGWWCAETFGDGLGLRPGIELPDSAVVPAGCAEPQDCDRLFSAATYCPGLDLWDPIGEALAAALERLRASTTRRGALLIVGNSPPYVSPSRASPIHRHYQSLRPRPSFRRWSAAWDRALEKCEREQIPVVYLFLTHDRYRPADQRNFEAFRHLQNQVQTALASCRPLEMVVRPAATDSVKRGIRESLDRMARGSAAISSVRVVR